MKLQPPAVLLMGPTGSGKTYSISTLVEAGLEVFVIVTEPRGAETLLDVAMARNLPLDKLHWKYVAPTRPGFERLELLGKQVSVMDQAQLANLKPAPRPNAAFLDLLATCRNFVSDKDGKSYGSIQDFGPDRAVVIDSLSGISVMAMDLTIGDKVVANPGEWQIAMSNISKLILSCTSDLNCFFVLIGHIEPETNEVTGVRQVMVSTLGRKLAPQLPKFFSEVISVETRVEAADKKVFTWSTNTQGFDLKSRALPVSGSLPPSFAPIVEAHRRRLAQVSNTGASQPGGAIMK